MTPKTRDRERLEAQARDLRKVERSEEASPDSLRRAVERANAARARTGYAPLDERPEPAEAAFYRRARALGLR